MKILRLIAEVKLTDRESMCLVKYRKLVWDLDTPIASVCDKPVKFVSAELMEETNNERNKK